MKRDYSKPVSTPGAYSNRNPYAGHGEPKTSVSMADTRTVEAVPEQKRSLSDRLKGLGKETT
jgi:hypothetical protein